MAGGQPGQWPCLSDPWPPDRGWWQPGVSHPPICPRVGQSRTAPRHFCGGLGWRGARPLPSAPGCGPQSPPLPSAPSRFPQLTGTALSRRRCPQLTGAVLSSRLRPSAPAAVLSPQPRPSSPTAALSPRPPSSAPGCCPQPPAAVLRPRLLPSAPSCCPQPPAAALRPRPAELSRRRVSGPTARRGPSSGTAPSRPGAPRRCRPPRVPTTPPGEGPSGRAPQPPWAEVRAVQRGCAIRHTRRVPPGWRGSSRARPTTWASPTMCWASSGPTTVCRRGSSHRCCSAWAPRPSWARRCRSHTCTTTRYRHRGAGNGQERGSRPGWQLRSVLCLAGLVFPHGKAGKEGRERGGSNCLLGLWARVAGRGTGASGRAACGTGESCRASESCCAAGYPGTGSPSSLPGS